MKTFPALSLKGGDVPLSHDVPVDDVLAARLAELEAAHTSAELGIAVIDRDLRYLRINPHLAAMNGLPAEAHVGRTLAELSPVLEQMMGPLLQRVLDTGEALVDFELRAPTPGDPTRERICRETVLPVRDGAGCIRALLITVRDITEHVLAEEARHRVEARYELALEAAGAGAYEHDGTFTETYWTGALYEMFGLARKEGPLALETDVFPRIDAECRPAIRAALADAVAGDGRLDIEFRVNRDDGTTRWLHAFGRRLGRGKRTGFGVVVDITNAKEREAALEEALARKQTLFAEANHRIKNNLQLVLSLLNLQAANATPEAATSLKQAISRVHVVGVLHDLMFQLDDVSRVDLSECLGLVCGAARDLVDGERVALSVDVPSVAVAGDVALPVALVVNELVTNAAKYAFPEARTGHISVSGEERDGRLEVVVEDDGVGFSEETPPGLGSKLVRALCRQADARLTRRDGGPGTCFVLDIPLSRGALLRRGRV